MVVRRVLISCPAQSNASPQFDLPTWLLDHLELNVENSTRLSIGAYHDRFTMPGNFPGMSQVDLKGVAMRGVRYLTFWSPVCTGYKTYPHTGRVLGHATNDATHIYVEQKFANVALPFNITRGSSQTVHTVTAISTAGLPVGAGCRLTLNAGTPWPTTGVGTANEQFAYALKTTGVAGNVITLNLQFGILGTGTIAGLKLVGVSGANVGQQRRVTGWNDATREATYDGAALAAPGADDLFELRTPNDVPFHLWAYWLPWCRFQAATIPTRPNPYWFGFNHPNHYHVPELYGGMGGTMTVKAAFHTAVAARLQESLGEEIYVIPMEVGGVSLARSELQIAPGDVGWFDPGQFTSWAPGEPNNLWQRFMDVIDAGKIAAAVEGDTLEALASVMFAGETDGSIERAAKNYRAPLRRICEATTQVLIEKGLWKQPADRYPIVLPKILVDSPWAFAKTVNKHIATVATQRLSARTIEVEDVPHAGGHYTAAGAPLLEARVFEAIDSIMRTTPPLNEREALEIANQALGLLGQPSNVTSLEPPNASVEARRCAQFLGPARDAVLQEHTWSIATERVRLVEIDNTVSTWAFAYAVPANLLKVNRILDPLAPDDVQLLARSLDDGAFRRILRSGSTTGASQRYRIEAEDGFRVLRTNQRDAVCVYTKSNVRFGLWPPHMRNACANYLAYLIAGDMQRGKESIRLVQGFFQQAMVLIARAAADDAEFTADTPPEPGCPWLPDSGAP